MKTYINPTDFILFPDCNTNKKEDFIRVVTLLCFYHSPNKELRKSDVVKTINNLYQLKFSNVIVEDTEVHHVFIALQKSGYLQPKLKSSPFWVKGSKGPMLAGALHI